MDLSIPVHLAEAGRTPVFTFESVPSALTGSHRTTVWAELRVQAGNVRFIDLEGDSPRDVEITAGGRAVIRPFVEHRIEPSADAACFVQFYRAAPGGIRLDELSTAAARHRSGPWQHRRRDLDTVAEVTEMVTRQYVDVVQDELLAPRFEFGPSHIDWQSHIGSVTDFWCHVLLFAPDYEIDVIGSHQRLHQRAAFTPELFDRWLQVFDDTVDGGWSGPNATIAKKRATGVAWAMAQRLLGHGVWRPSAHATPPGGGDGRRVTASLVSPSGAAVRLLGGDRT